MGMRRQKPSRELVLSSSCGVAEMPEVSYDRVLGGPVQPRVSM